MILVLSRIQYDVIVYQILVLLFVEFRTLRTMWTVFETQTTQLRRAWQREAN